MSGRGITFLISGLRLGDHVHVQVYSGRNPGARGNAGKLVLRADEWESFRSFFDGEPSVEVRYATSDSPLARLENA